MNEVRLHAKAQLGVAATTAKSTMATAFTLASAIFINQFAFNDSKLLVEGSKGVALIV